MNTEKRAPLSSRLLSALLALVMAVTMSAVLAAVPTVALAEGDETSSEQASTISVSFQLVGADDEVWAYGTYDVESGTTAAELFEQALGEAGISYYAYESSWGWYLDSITFDGVTYAYDSATGEYWQFFYNGEASDSGAGDVTLSDGDSVAFYYSAYGDTLPEIGVETGGSEDAGVTEGAGVTEDAGVRDVTATWNGFANGLTGATTTASTPTTSAELAWSLSLKGSASWVNASDPVIADGYLYVVADSQLLKINPDTGTVVATVALDASAGYTCRPVCADGLLLIPLAGGMLQAVDLETLTVAWTCDAIDGDQQALSSLTVIDGYVYYGTYVYGTNAGYYRCVNISDGTEVWCYESESGYYWAGGASVGSYVVVGNYAGTLMAFDAATGRVVFYLRLDDSIRSTTMVGEDGCLYVVTTDGVLHRVILNSDGILAETGSVQFAAYSTSTPTIVDGYAYVGGSTSSYGGLLAVIDLSDMSVAYSITTTADGEEIPTGSGVQSTPLVSVQDGGTYVYFTNNAEPGAVYVYKLGKTTASLLFEPTGDLANWCVGSVIPGSDGALYYINDSGYLMKLASTGDEAEEGAGETTDTTGETTDTADDETTDTAGETTDATAGETTSTNSDDAIAATAASDGSATPATGDDASSSWLAALAAGITALAVGVCTGLRGCKEDE